MRNRVRSYVRSFGVGILKGVPAGTWAGYFAARMYRLGVRNGRAELRATADAALALAQVRGRAIGRLQRDNGQLREQLGQLGYHPPAPIVWNDGAGGAASSRVDLR